MLYLMFNEVPWDSDLKVQATSKVTYHQYLLASCVQAYPLFELNPLLKKLIFTVRVTFEILVLWACHSGNFQVEMFLFMDGNLAQSVHKLNNLVEKCYFFAD